MLRCCQRSNCTNQTIQAWSLIVTGVAMISIVPLVIGCLGKYGHINLGRPISKGMVLSGSLGTAFGGIALINIILARTLFREHIENFMSAAQNYAQFRF
jgi:hypothetical protein